MTSKRHKDDRNVRRERRQRHQYTVHDSIRQRINTKGELVLRHCESITYLQDEEKNVASDTSKNVQCRYFWKSKVYEYADDNVNTTVCQNVMKISDRRLRISDSLKISDFSNSLGQAPPAIRLWISG